MKYQKIVIRRSLTVNFTEEQREVVVLRQGFNFTVLFIYRLNGGVPIVHECVQCLSVDKVQRIISLLKCIENVDVYKYGDKEPNPDEIMFVHVENEILFYILTK